jgi:hypothetical protein
MVIQHLRHMLAAEPDAEDTIDTQNRVKNLAENNNKIIK